MQSQGEWTEMTSAPFTEGVTMRKMSLFVLLLCLVFGTAGVAAAKATTHSAKGPVTTVDATAKSFAVKGKSGTETFTVTGSTKIEEHGKAITLSDLKSGEDVMVWYTKNAGRNEATKVIVQRMKDAKGSKTGTRR